MFCIKWKLIVALYFLNLRIEAIPSGSQKKKMASEIKSIKVKSQNSDMQPRRNKFNSRQSYYIKVAQRDIIITVIQIENYATEIIGDLK